MRVAYDSMTTNDMLPFAIGAQKTHLDKHTHTHTSSPAKLSQCATKHSLMAVRYKPGQGDLLNH